MMDYRAAVVARNQDNSVFFRKVTAEQAHLVVEQSANQNEKKIQRINSRSGREWIDSNRGNYDGSLSDLARVFST